MAFGRRLVVFPAVLLFAAAGWAQKKPAPISLDVVVTAKRGGAPVAGLTAQDFTVLDNRTPQKITSFHALGGSTAPVEVILVIDAVNAYYTTVAYERDQIDRFLRANGGRLRYPTKLAFFTDTGTQIQNGFTQDGNALSKSMDNHTVAMRDIRRSAGIYGAGERLDLSMKTMRELAEYGTAMPGRKLLVWISPGWPMLAGPAIYLTQRQQEGVFGMVVTLSTELRRARMTVYSIDPLGTADAGTLRDVYYQNFVKGIRKPTQAEFGDVALPVLAVQTGGQVLNSSNDLTSLLQKALADTDAYYELTFQPDAGEPTEFHALEVKVAKPGLVARTRTGYYGE